MACLDFFQFITLTVQSLCVESQTIPSTVGMIAGFSSLPLDSRTAPKPPIRAKYSTGQTGSDHSRGTLSPLHSVIYKLGEFCPLLIRTGLSQNLRARPQGPMVLDTGSIAVIKAKDNYKLTAQLPGIQRAFPRISQPQDIYSINTVQVTQRN